MRVHAREVANEGFQEGLNVCTFVGLKSFFKSVVRESSSSSQQMMRVVGGAVFK